MIHIINLSANEMLSVSQEIQTWTRCGILRNDNIIANT
jgi:hypothetical protein